MMRFAETFPDPEIVSALRRQLTWTHFKQLVYIDDELKRAFYVEMSRVEGWSTRELNERIDGMLYERTALSKKPEAIIRRELSALREKGEVSPALVFRDPYMLDFLELATRTARGISSPPSFAKSSASYSSWEPGSRSSRGRSGSRSTATTTTSTSCSSIDACNASWRSS
jgi:hypothetical protein